MLVLDCRAFGGQAGASSRIENYLGFPTGITGMALMARAYNQAQKFGVEMAIPDEVEVASTRRADGAAFALRARRRRAGARARGRDRERRPLPAPRRREPRGVRGHSACTTGPRRSRRGCAPARRWRWSAPAIRPARRSVYLAEPRAQGLGAGARRRASRRACRATWSTASRRCPTSRWSRRREVAALEGSDGMLEAVRWRQRARGGDARARSATCSSSSAPIRTPTGSRAPTWRSTRRASCAPARRPARAPRPLETSRPGVFAIGDVRSGSVKRVAAAVGEGAQVVAALHAFLAGTRHLIRSEESHEPNTARTLRR